MKYIQLKEKWFILFWNHFTHKEFYQEYFNSENIISAWFVSQDWKVYGESISLNKKTLPDTQERFDRYFILMNINNMYNLIQLKTEDEEVIQKVFDFLTENNINYSLPEEMKTFCKDDFESWRTMIISNDLYEEDDDE